MAIRFGNGFAMGTTGGGGAGISPYWVESLAGYTEVTGGVTAPDDGYIIDPITLPYDFYQNGDNSNLLYVSTNGVVSLGNGYSTCCPNSPQDNSNLFAGNPGDMFMNPGDSMVDGSTMGAWYKITDYGSGVFKVEIKVFNIVLSAAELISSYQVNLYRDVDYQYMESWAKSRPSDYNNPTTMGPYNSSDVSVPTSKTRNVWRGDLNGQNWTSLGNISVPFNQVAVTPTPTPSNAAPLSQYTPNGTDGGNGLITYLNRDTGINASSQLPDQSGFNNDYSYSGSNPYSAGVGYTFGSGKYAYSSFNTQYNQIYNSMTIEMWVKLPSIPGSMSLVAAGGNNSGGWALRLDGAGSQINLVKYNVADQAVYLPYSLQTDTWYHLTVAQGGTSLTFFINGEIVGAYNNAVTNNFSIPTGNVNVSKDFYTGTNGDLTMGMLKIYDYCKLTTDVVNEFNSHKADYGFAVTPTPTPTPTPSSTPIASVTPTPSVTPTTSSSASAPMVVTISESGSNVVMTSTGTINLSGLTLVTSGAGPMMGGGLGTGTATFISGPNSSYFDEYSGFTSTPSSFGSGGGSQGSSSSGDIFGIIFNMAPPYVLVVPTGYTSGVNISSTQTFTGQTLSSLGLTNGTYTYTWSGGSIDVVVGGPAPTPTPTPSVGAVTAGWNFYEASGNALTVPPLSNGQALFYNTPPPVSTLNPNYEGGSKSLMFYKNDSAGTSYQTQFQNLTNNGGTINVTQNGQTATYTTGTPGAFNYNSGDGFLIFSAALQTATVASAFTYTDKITLTFS